MQEGRDEKFSAQVTSEWLIKCGHSRSQSESVRSSWTTVDTVTHALWSGQSQGFGQRQESSIVEIRHTFQY